MEKPSFGPTIRPNHAIMAAGAVKQGDKAPTGPKAGPIQDGIPADLEEMSKANIKALAETIGIDPKGKIKEALISEIRAIDAQKGHDK